MTQIWWAPLKKENEKKKKKKMGERDNKIELHGNASEALNQSSVVCEGSVHSP